MTNKTLAAVFLVTLGGDVVSGANPASAPTTGGAGDAERMARVFCRSYLEKFAPLKRASARAWWEASVSGTDEAFKRRREAESALVDLHSDRDMFAKLVALRGDARLRDPVLKRQLEVMYFAFLPNQAEPGLQKRVIALEGEVEQIFNTHRSLIDGTPKTENEVRAILSESTNSAEAEKAWKGYMAVGARIEPKLRELVGLRNRIARDLGYRDFFALRMAVQEIDEAELFGLFDELDTLTREPFVRAKRDLDAKMARRFGISTSELRPWHFGDLFFQEAPDVQEVNLDDALAGKDLLKAARSYYASIGMPVDAILERSDLYEKEGKSPHAFCSDLDRAGDVRILCNLRPNAYWMDTLVHELGHAVYDQYLRTDLPFDLREAADAITTEGIAMMFGAMVKTEEWYKRVLKLPEEEADRFAAAARESLRLEKLIFSRWTQVVMRFERGMYANPDQNLGKLWWELKGKYQLLPSPGEVNRPDYAAKLHIIGAPVYYHSYMMGELFGSQVRHYIAERVLNVKNGRGSCFFGRKEVGEYLREKVFGPGKLYPWRELPKFATGERLSPKYYAEQYIE